MVKRIIKFLCLFLLLIGIGVLSSLAFYHWRKQLTYDDKLTLTATYMKYACGDCSVDMKVNRVNDARYRFIIGKDVFPIPEHGSFYDLCDYVSYISFNSSTQPDDTGQPFILVGRLHKYSHDWPWVSCSETPYFTVEKLKYGVNGKWIHF